jgi:hypothetical protein
MSVHRSYQPESGLSQWARQVPDKRVYAVLATTNPDGTQHTVPTGYAFDGERLLIQSGTGTRKVRHVEADPRVRVLVQARPRRWERTAGWRRPAPRAWYAGRRRSGSTPSPTAAISRSAYR